MTQRTSRPVSEGLAKQIGRMVEDASLNYPGGTAMLELVKGDPDFIQELYRHFDAHAAKCAVTLAFNERPAWMTIKLGTQKKVADLRKGILDVGDRIGDWGDDTLKRTAVASEPTEIELFRATVAEIGFPSGGTWAQIRAELDEFGFGNCPAEVGPQLRLQYTNQPNGEWLWVVMEPITDSVGFLGVFCVAHDSDVRWLCSGYGRPDGVLDGAYGLVFCRK